MQGKLAIHRLCAEMHTIYVYNLVRITETAITAQTNAVHDIWSIHPDIWAQTFELGAAHSFAS